MKTKTIRIAVGDAFELEQAAREISAEMKKDISVGLVFKELIKHIDKVKNDMKKKPL